MKTKIKNQQANQQTKKLSSPLRTGTTFYDHIVELRKRALWVAVFAIVFSAIAYNYHTEILAFIMAPLKGEKLIYLTPGGGFSFIFLVTMYAGLLASLPVLIYHLHSFIKPALPVRAQRSAIKILFASSLLIIGGVLYGYYVAIPAALEFLMNFAGDTVTASLTAESYLNFFLAYVAGLAFLSLLPLFLMFAHWIRPLKPGGLLKSERWVILFAFVAAALITPTPDVVNQAMIAGPVIAIYQIGVVSVLIMIMKDKREHRRAEMKKKETESLIGAPIESLFLGDDSATESVIGTDHPARESSATVVPHPTSPSSVAKQPIHRIRSVDGFHRATARTRSSVVVRERSAGGRTSMDGIVSRSTQVSQN